jgi:hypothetical protein
MHRRLPWYVPLMFILTAGYLAIEIPFSVHLAAVLGGNPTADDIHNIERFGRTLSGIAAAVAIVGMWHFPRMDRLGVSRVRACVSGLVIGAVVGSVTYMSLNAYADIRAEIADGQERKEAVIALLAKRAITETGFINQLGLNEHQRNGFLAAMPEIMSSDTMVAKSGRSLVQLASYAGEDLKEALGSASEFKREFFENRFDAGQEAFARYQELLDKTKSAHNRLEAEAENAWSDYKSRMDSAYPRGWPRRPGISGAMAWRKVRFGAGIPVPENWNLRDKAPFVAAVKKKGMDEIVQNYANAVESMLGKGVHLKPGLSYEQFLALPAVQKKIRDRMYGVDLPKGVIITPAMNDKTFEKALYAPKIEQAIADMHEAISASASDFEYGRLADQGKDAVKAKILPALAIVLSLTGAIVHIFKFSGYGLQIFAHIARIRPLQIAIVRHAVAATLIAVAGYLYFGLTTTSFSSPAIERIADEGIYSTILAGTVLVQPQLAEIGETLTQVGAWDVIAQHLPAPRPHTSFVASAETVASIIPESDEVASLPQIVPIPIARPTN